MDNPFWGALGSAMVLVLMITPMVYVFIGAKVLRKNSDPLILFKNIWGILFISVVLGLTVLFYSLSVIYKVNPLGSSAYGVRSSHEN